MIFRIQINNFIKARSIYTWFKPVGSQKSVRIFFSFLILDRPNLAKLAYGLIATLATSQNWKTNTSVNL